MAAGAFLGLACGTMFFASFLVPIWIGYYWGRGTRRFLLAFSSVTAVLIGSLVCSGSLTKCGSKCVDLTQDAANCGACGRRCPATRPSG